MDKKQLRRFYQEIGVDEVVSEVPLNRFEESSGVSPSGDLKEASREKLVSSDLKSDLSSPPSAGARIVAPPLVSSQVLGNQASQRARQASSLQELKEELSRFEGCPLRYTATHLVFSDGNPQSQVMVIGEAPGAEEDQQGKPFVGLSGQLLDRMFQFVGLDRNQLYITNMVPWRPPGNRQPSSSELAVCLPFLQRHIELIAPKFLLLVGGTAAKTLLQRTDGIMKFRGQWQEYSLPGLPQPIPTLAMYHPAYLLRSPGQKKEAWKDLLTLRRALDAA